MRKIGIMGGTFDPIHIGHLILGENACQQFGLEKVIFMPAGNPPHKQHRDGRASNEDRMKMVGLAIASNPHFELSDVEMNEKGFTYTYRTLELLKKLNPDAEYYFIIGADSLFDFDKWMKPQRICDACTIVAATRNHTSSEALDAAIAHVAETYRASIYKLDTENIDVSSNMIREWITEDRTIRYYVPDSVIDYIREHDVYAGLKPTMRVK
ncbi:MAG TPA: nicotinate-nucleotide adenylyltransferase [Lachnospiraceae bacterium]|nr:nicotinate-nucleotide adenylyltransferase [Lachnospiraceae bacterium]